MRKLFSILLVSFVTPFLGGCYMGNAYYTQDQVRTLVIAKCPVLKSYSLDQMKKAADELKLLPDDSQVAVMMTDYSKMRDACRAITKKLKQVASR